jgi:hypothetical protein
MAYSGGTDRDSAARQSARRAAGGADAHGRRGLLRSALVFGFLASASAVACSLVLQDQSLPCTTDADCAKYTGSMCDPIAQHCVAGTPSDGSVIGDGGSDSTTTGVKDGADSTSETSVGPGDDSSLEDGGAPDALDDVGSGSNDAGDGGSGPVDAAADAADAADAGPGINWPALTKYLDDLYNPSQALLESSPASTTYYTSPDNALAQRAFLYLPVPDTTKSAAILTRLMSMKICGCSSHPGHDATINHQFDPLVTKGMTIPLDPSGACTGAPTDTRSPGGACVASPDAAIGPVCPPTGIWHEDRPPSGSDAGQQWSADQCNSTAIGGYSLPQWSQAGVGNGYGDLIALEILSYRNQNLSTSALWSLLMGKWDNVGIYDAADGPSSSYSTYKLALFKLCARALGQPLPAGVDAMLVAAQGSNGGIRASYTSSTAFVDQAGNTETTALVALAFLLPTSDL